VREGERGRGKLQNGERVIEENKKNQKLKRDE